MQVRVLRTFKDLEGKALRNQGDVFEVTKKRFEEINSTKHGVLVEPVDSVEPEAEEEAWPNGQDD